MIKDKRIHRDQTIQRANLVQIMQAEKVQVQILRVQIVKLAFYEQRMRGEFDLMTVYY